MTEKSQLPSQSKIIGLSTWAVKLRDVVLGLLGMACLFMATYQAWNDKLAASGVLFTAGLILIIFSRLSRFESIKGLGIEAKMVAIDQKIDELEKIKESMRNIVGMSADVSFQLMGRIGRWDAEVPKEQARAIAKNFKQQLLELGDSEEKIKQRMAPWHESNLRDLMRPVYKALMDIHLIQSQRLSERTRNFEVSLPSDAPERRDVEELFEKNKRFLKLVSDHWEGDIHDFVLNVDDLIAVSPIDAPLELQAFRKRLSLSLADAKIYLTNWDFRI